MIKLGKKAFEVGDDVAFRMWCSNRFKTYIGNLHSVSVEEGTITLSNCKVSREQINGLLTVKIEECSDFNYVCK